MSDLKFSMSNKWKCTNCKISNENRASKCAFCNTPRPSEDAIAESDKEHAKKEHEEMMKLLFRLINPLHINQKKRILRYIEDGY